MTKLACIPLFVVACALLYYGTGMLLFVPGYPGENYLKSLFSGRFLYGVLPSVSSVALLVTVGWLWDRSNGSRDLAKAIGRSFSLALGAIVLFWIGLIVVADFRHPTAVNRNVYPKH